MTKPHTRFASLDGNDRSIFSIHSTIPIRSKGERLAVEMKDLANDCAIELPRNFENTRD
jgi:hypothetical protein